MITQATNELLALIQSGCDDFDKVSALVEKGANVNATDSMTNGSVLHRCAAGRLANSYGACLLAPPLGGKVDLTAKDLNGDWPLLRVIRDPTNTSLHVTVFAFVSQTVNACLGETKDDLIVNWDQPDRDGKKILQLAADNGCFLTVWQEVKKLPHFNNPSARFNVGLKPDDRKALSSEDRQRFV
jgi:hypothetical protein